MEDERLAQYKQERAELAAAIEKAVNGQFIGKPPPLLTGWSERAVAAVVTAGWLPPAAVTERVHTAVQVAFADAPLTGEAMAMGLLTPQAVSRYLGDHGWELEARERGVREVWALPGVARLMLPFATDYVDYSARFLDALRILAKANNWDAAQLAATILPNKD